MGSTGVSHVVHHACHAGSTWKLESFCALLVQYTVYIGLMPGSTRMFVLLASLFVANPTPQSTNPPNPWGDKLFCSHGNSRGITLEQSLLTQHLHRHWGCPACPSCQSLQMLAMLFLRMDGSGAIFGRGGFTNVE